MKDNLHSFSSLAKRTFGSTKYINGWLGGNSVVGCVDDKMFCEIIFKKSTNVMSGKKTGDPE